MTANLNSAFNFILSKKTLTCQLERKGKFSAIDITMSPSSYSNKKDGPDNTIKYVSEYLISLEELQNTNYNPPKRGDRLIFNFGTSVQVISEVEPLYGLGNNNLFGWRIRGE